MALSITPSPVWRLLPLIAALNLSHSQAIEIELDYSFDTLGFFNQPGSREAMRAAADFYERIITDSFLDITPGGSNNWSLNFNNPATGLPVSLSNQVIPADTIRVYAGGRPLTNSNGEAGYGGRGIPNATAAWIDRVTSRGQPGGGTMPTPLNSSPSDFTPWGGFVSFNTNNTWNFSQTTPSTNGSTDFIPTALHELAHVLGLGPQSSPWTTRISNSQFIGSQAVAQFGAPVPLSPAQDHWRDDGTCVANEVTGGFDPNNPNNVVSQTLPIFGTPGGRDQIVLLDPITCLFGPNLKVLTMVDIAALDDIGWDIDYSVISPVPRVTITANANGTFSLTWPSISGTIYRVQENADLTTWRNLGAPLTGNGATLSFIASSPPPSRNFYRLSISPPAAVQAPPRL